jgi:hypothetical protein
MALPDATLLNYPEKCTTEGKGYGTSFAQQSI